MKLNVNWGIKIYTEERTSQLRQLSIHNVNNTMQITKKYLGFIQPSRLSCRTGFLESQDRGSRFEVRGSRIEDRGSTIEGKYKPNHEVPSAQDIEEGLIKIKFLNYPKQT